MNDEIEQIKDDLKAKQLKVSPIPSKDLLSSGSTLLNLAVSGKPRGCFSKGRYFWLVGDSDSGKTFLAMTCFAEAAINKNFDGYRFIFDDVEGGALMDLHQFFGKAADRIEPPSPKGNSSTVESFYYYLDDALAHTRPCIYVLDSMDCLSTEDEQEQFTKRKNKAQGKTKGEVSGSYGVGKAKANASNLRAIQSKLRDTGSILIIISQTHDNIGFGAQYTPKKASGGHALKFYAAAQLWSSPAGHLKHRDVEQGILSKVKVKKNRLTGRNRDVTVPILHSHGIDDVGGNIDWLVEVGYWSSTGKDGAGKINAKEFDVELKREGLIRHIQKNDADVELQQIVTKEWNRIEEDAMVERTSRYH